MDLRHGGIVFPKFTMTGKYVPQILLFRIWKCVVGRNPCLWWKTGTSLSFPHNLKKKKIQPGLKSCCHDVYLEVFHHIETTALSFCGFSLPLWCQRTSSRPRERPFLGPFSRCLSDEEDDFPSWPFATLLAGLQWAMFIVHMAEDNPNNTHSMRRVQLDCWENKTSEDEKAEEVGVWELQAFPPSARVINTVIN